jgi:hypothetical protein
MDLEHNDQISNCKHHMNHFLKYIKECTNKILSDTVVLRYILRIELEYSSDVIEEISEKEPRVNLLFINIQNIIIRPMNNKV